MGKELTPPRPCRDCGRPIRLLLTMNNHWRVVDADSRYLVCDNEGAAVGLCATDGRRYEGTWSWPRQGAVIVYPPHICERAGGHHAEG